MIKKNYKDVHFINKGTQVIDKVYKDNQLVFEQGYTREQEGVPPLTTTYKALGKDLKDYKIYGNTILRVLPEEYQQVEYIQNSNTQYIDTGVMASANFKFHIKYKDVAGEESNYVTGSRATSSGSIYGGISGSAGTKAINVTQTALATPNNYRVPNASYDVTSEYNSEGTGTATLKNLNTNETLTGTQSAQIASTVTQKIFAIRSAQIHSGMALYEYQCWNDGVLVRNFVPCYRKSDNVAGLYDTVGNTFYTRSGSGDFIVGPNVTSSAPTTLAPVEVESVGDYISSSRVPEEYREVEYLESTGTQYIDLLRVPNNDDIIEQKFQHIYSGTGTESWYGSMPSANVTTPRVCLGAYKPSGIASLFASVNATVVIAQARANDVLTVRFQSPVFNRFEYAIDGSSTTTYPTYSQDVTAYTPAIQLTSYLFARHGNDGVQSYDGNGTKIYYHKEYLADGTLQMNLIPCIRKSDNKPGMYDLVTDTFFTNQGTGEFVAGPTIKRYIIPVTVSGKNLFDSNSVYSDTSKFTVEDGVISGTSTNFHKVYFYIPSDLVGKELTFSAYLKTTTPTNIRVMASVGESILNGNYVNSRTDFGRSSVTFTPTSTSDYVKITYGTGNSTIYAKDIQLEEGSATEYEPYAEPTTVNIYVDEPLRKGGEIADYIDFKNQKVVRVLDEVDMGELRYTNNGTDSVWGALTIRESGSQNGLTSKLKQVAGSMAANAMPNNTFKFYTTSTSVAVKMTGISASNATEMLSGTRLVYELATPTEEIITLPSIPTVKGTTVYEVDTKIQPSKMYIKYKGR